MSMITTLCAKAVGQLGNGIKAGKAPTHFTNNASPKLNSALVVSSVQGRRAIHRSSGGSLNPVLHLVNDLISIGNINIRFSSPNWRNWKPYWGFESKFSPTYKLTLINVIWEAGAVHAQPARDCEYIYYVYVYAFVNVNVTYLSTR